VSDAAVALFTEAEAALTVAKETAAAATSGPSAQATVSEAEIYEFTQVQQSITDDFAIAYTCTTRHSTMLNLCAVLLHFIHCRCVCARCNAHCNCQ
jgi:hypothetical protein